VEDDAEGNKLRRYDVNYILIINYLIYYLANLVFKKEIYLVYIYEPEYKTREYLTSAYGTD
jgi:hypothetical protein